LARNGKKHISFLFWPWGKGLGVTGKSGMLGTLSGIKRKGKGTWDRKKLWYVFPNHWGVRSTGTLKKVPFLRKKHTIKKNCN